MSPARDAAKFRKEHVQRYIKGRGIRRPDVLRAMETVPREIFVPDVSLEMAYGDHPVPIDCGQTISQPYMVAWMTELLDPKKGQRVLEVGTGSGYQTAVLASLVDEVYTIEYHPALSEGARRLLEHHGFTNVKYKAGDGSLGWPEEAPFDGICVTAAAPEVPKSLLAQLKDGGRMVIPVGGRWIQDLVLVRREGRKTIESKLGGCRFVPLRGEEGWT